MLTKQQEEVKQTNVRIDPKLWAKFKRTVYGIPDMSIQKATAEAIQDWIEKHRQDVID